MGATAAVFVAAIVAPVAASAIVVVMEYVPNRLYLWVPATSKPVPSAVMVPVDAGLPSPQAIAAVNWRRTPGGPGR
jgi:hypothetical protein